MRLGDFANGFREYEWRWQTPDFKERPSYRNIPEWQGEPLTASASLSMASRASATRSSARHARIAGVTGR